MSTTSASVLHLSRRATVLAALTLALLGSAAFTTAARADFTLNSGKITITAGSTTGTPPTGSWVTLPSDDGGGAYFTNPSSTWTGTPDKIFTVIRPGATTATGLTLGAAQPSGGIIGSGTDAFNGLPWTLVTVSAPVLTFGGNDNSAGTRPLTTGSDLSGLRVVYNGTTYTVGTAFEPGPHRLQPLRGEVVGNTTTNGAATITLGWTTDLTEPGGFGTFRAQFQLVGTYDR
jgi:hypothetical protein